MEGEEGKARQLKCGKGGRGGNTTLLITVLSIIHRKRGEGPVKHSGAGTAEGQGERRICIFGGEKVNIHILHSSFMAKIIFSFLKNAPLFICFTKGQRGQGVKFLG